MMALKFAVSSSTEMKGRRGRQQVNLLSVLKCDLRDKGLDFDEIMDMASDRGGDICEVSGHS